MEDFASTLSTRTRLGVPLHHLASTGSTNDDAKVGARGGAPHGSLWIAETQSQGRGRQGRAWSSPPGENLLFSVLLRISCAPMRVPPLALVVGLAVRDAVAKVVGDRAAVKWPNDVVVREGDGIRKLAGVLVESAIVGSHVEHLVVGVGINVHTRAFPEGLRDRATSLALQCGHDASRAELLADVLAGIERDVERVAHHGLGSVHARLTAADVLLGRNVEVDGVSGVGAGIDAEGRLLVQRADGGVVRIGSGEVAISTSVSST